MHIRCLNADNIYITLSDGTSNSYVGDKTSDKEINTNEIPLLRLEIPMAGKESWSTKVVIMTKILIMMTVVITVFYSDDDNDDDENYNGH